LKDKDQKIQIRDTKWYRKNIKRTRNRRNIKRNR